ncbi:energy transducer TonB [Fulvivirga lutea]|uniref:Energy transducer TonB n=1 Tax=Fulvivirga lutea TaxID=2810512 RepID=A0A975A002_9BACT|nr:energy transducer TonB [Fulvivirga lutea]QSE96311.1 energy transducer TonB [Fulvivirga lutea]
MGLHRDYFDRQADFRILHKKEPKQKLVRLYDQAKIFNDLFEIKQAKKKQYESLRGLLFNIGLFLSLTIVTLIINWKFYDTGKLVDLTANAIYEDELFEVPPTEQTPPEPIKVLKQPNIIEVPDEETIKEEIKIDLDISIDEDTEFEAIDIIASEEPMEEVADEVFTIVENQPVPNGGLASFYSYINNNIKYPAAARRSNVQGKVFVQFVVNKDGRLTDLEVIKGIGMGCDEEALRVIANADPWIPGKQRGKPVRVKMVIPIQFVLNQQ